MSAPQHESQPAAVPAPSDPVALAAASERAVLVDPLDWGIVSIEGGDAAAFLHGQLSTDVRRLSAGTGRWTSYNSPKGRMLATLYLYRRPGPEPARFAALLAADLAPAVARRLAMFVLRSKVAVRDVTREHRIAGVAGAHGARAIEAALGLRVAPGGVVDHEGADVAALPDGRFVLVMPPDGAAARVDALAAHAVRATPEAWTWFGIRSGVPMITAATHDQFVPQTANWDAVGGIDFDKGCYPGQEIVARMQYLGRLKERLYPFASASEPPAPGTRLYGEAFGDQASGTVVNSARSPAGGSEFLAVVQQAAVDAGPLAIGAPDGPSAAALPLPYALPAPRAPRRSP